MSIRVMPINASEAVPWLLAKHYAHRKCSISYCFGAYRGCELIGIVTYGMPPSPHLCSGICGMEFKENVLELNRLCCENTKNVASTLVGRSLSMLPRPAIVVSFADTAQGHVGYVYQATNFIYTGKTDSDRKTPRMDRCLRQGKHGRHDGRLPDGTADENAAVVRRKPKHRYVFFVGSKHQKALMINNLRYQKQPYPKGESSHYDTGGPVERQVVMAL